MKITLELNLTPDEARTLNDWASVGRTIGLAISTLECMDIDEVSQEDEELSEKADQAIEELMCLKQPLNSIHQQIRQALWAISGGVKGPLPQ